MMRMGWRPSSCSCRTQLSVEHSRDRVFPVPVGLWIRPFTRLLRHSIIYHISGFAYIFDIHFLPLVQRKWAIYGSPIGLEYVLTSFDVYVNFIHPVLWFLFL